MWGRWRRTSPGPTTCRRARAPPGPAPEQVPEDAPEEETEAAVDDIPEPAPAWRRWIVPGVLTVLALAGVLAALLLLPEDETAATEPGPAPEETAIAPPAFLSPEPATPEDGCSRAALLGAGDFQAQAEAARACGEALAPDTWLGLVEDAAAQEDAAALLMFGMLYDAGWHDAAIEDAIGLSFGDDPAQAAEYYSRAAAAGSPAAPDRLAAVCAVLARGATTLQEAAHDDYCT